MNARSIAIAIVVSCVVVSCATSGDTASTTTSAGPTPQSSTTTTAVPDSAAPTEVTTSTASEPTLFGKVDIGGRSLFVNCQGSPKPNVPTVVFENGLGGTTHVWASVQRELSELTLACGYDRAGLGQSDPPTRTPRTARDQADDLALLLTASHLPGPFVFVSWSLGPWTTAVYASLHPESVAGLVFVDPKGPDVTDEWISALESLTGTEADDAAEILATELAFRDDPTSNDENLDVPASVVQVREALQLLETTLGERPVAILSADGTRDYWAGLPDGARQAWDSAWVKGQNAYALGSTVQQQAVASSHMIPEDQPATIVQTVTELLAYGTN